MLASHTARTTLHSLTPYSTKGGQCKPATQHPRTTLHLGRIHLLPTAAKKDSVSQPLSTQGLRLISVGFTYFLKQRSRAVLAGHSAPRQYTPSHLGSLTAYSSEGGQC